MIIIIVRFDLPIQNRSMKIVRKKGRPKRQCIGTLLTSYIEYCSVLHHAALACAKLLLFLPCFARFCGALRGFSLSPSGPGIVSFCRVHCVSHADGAALYVLCAQAASSLSTNQIARFKCDSRLNNILLYTLVLLVKPNKSK